MTICSSAVLITGGGTGIGRATALELARQGARAVAVGYSVSEDEALETETELRALGVAALAVRADVRDETQIRQLVARVAEAFGGLDILVNNAGATRYVPLRDLEALTDEIWDMTFETNLRGTFHCCRAAAPHLKAARGAIVNVASIAGLKASGSSVAYCVSKAGVIHLTRVLAVAMAPEVRVNCVAPGLVQTRWFERGIGKGATARESARVAGETPLAATAMPQDVADAIVGLLRSRFVTGQNVVVDGGKGLTYD